MSSRPDPWPGSADAGTGHLAPAGSGAWYCKRRQLPGELPPRAERRLRACGQVRSFQSRDVLFGSQQTGGVLHLVVRGRVRLARFDADGGETQLAILEPGEAFREPRHAEVEPLRLYAEGVESGALLSVPLPDLAGLVRGDRASYGVLATALD